MTEPTDAQSPWPQPYGAPPSGPRPPAAEPSAAGHQDPLPRPGGDPDLTATAGTPGTEYLEAIGDQVTGPDVAMATVAQQELDDAGRGYGLGRLAELAVWWAQVSGDVRTGRAREVVLVRPAPRATATATIPRDPAPVRTLALDPPADPSGAVAWGIATADALVDAGTQLILVSAPDLIASRVLAAQLMGLDAVEANGWPSDYGVDDQAWMEQVTAIRDGLRGVKGLRGRPVELLQALDSPVLAAATGLLLRSAARRTPALLDGAGASAAALLAQRLSPYGRDWWQVGHLSDHPLHERCLSSLRLRALTRLGMTAEDGTGALLGLGVLDLAAELLPDAG
ncbi:MAG TPA: nicotinate-nucleotide--dimethylbenzimidazole phosphoribosyltransferase [Kineosporiaceae bacterium]|nr:nicotinate-nucleotide--dimethylbenzimidazole phosphoribosyltransferase [Kineosporiaceae bacterium]